MGWDGRKITGPISAGEKSFVIRIKPTAARVVISFLLSYYWEKVVSLTPQRIKVLLFEDGSHPGVWASHQMEKGRA